jgi:hypothetical protein
MSALNRITLAAIVIGGGVAICGQLVASFLGADPIGAALAGAAAVVAAIGVFLLDMRRDGRPGGPGT